ncbi:uncharacterized protein G2W53_004305 [Senna tora]|uniref:Uncharacterized protein n=1 Tax=Senna tora TaxID=362788 RepID=A0A834XC36_9FABA|nr:uncharacterized protein G2W53_004305 [Senna tora]
MNGSREIGEANLGVAGTGYETGVSGLPFAVHNHREWSCRRLKTEDEDSKSDIVSGVATDMVPRWRSRTVSMWSPLRRSHRLDLLGSTKF